jgi:hypothetical protein
LEYGLLSRRTNGGRNLESAQWQRSDTFVIPRWPERPAGTFLGWFWARRGCNDDMVSDVFEAFGVSPE